MIHCLKERGYGSIEADYDPLITPDPLPPREGQILFTIIDEGDNRRYEWELTPFESTT